MTTVPVRRAGGLHHVELWVPDRATAVASWGWLFDALGWTLYQEWPTGRSWRHGDGAYMVIEQSPALTSGTTHDRCAPGLNHLAFRVRASTDVDRIVGEANEHGWSLLFADRHPHAGGPDMYAAYLEDRAGFEVEIVADG